MNWLSCVDVNDACLCFVRRKPEWIWSRRGSNWRRHSVERLSSCAWLRCWNVRTVSGGTNSAALATTSWRIMTVWPTSTVLLAAVLGLRPWCLLPSPRCRRWYLLIFAVQCYASTVLAMGPCPCLSVSVASRCSTETAKHRITQTTPHDSPGTHVFWCQRSPRNSTGVAPYGAPNAGGWVKIGDFRLLTGYISKTVQDRRMVSVKVE